jgi:hypothetical protein
MIRTRLSDRIGFRVCLNKRHKSPIGLKTVTRCELRLDRPTQAASIALFDEYRKFRLIWVGVILLCQIYAFDLYL